MSRQGPPLLAARFNATISAAGDTAPRGDRWRRPPVADGNLHLPAGRTSTLGVCAHCGLALRLACNDDAGEYTIAHEYPVCQEWLARGILVIGKRGA